MTFQVAEIRIRETRSQETAKGIEKEITISETTHQGQGENEKKVERVIKYDVVLKKALPAKRAFYLARSRAMESYFEKKRKEGWTLTKVRRLKPGVIQLAFCKKE